MAKAEWEKPEPCPKITRAAMMMRRLEKRNRYVPFKEYRDGQGPHYSKAQLSNLGREYVAVRDLLLRAAGKVGATREQRENEKEDTSVAAELLLVLLRIRRGFRGAVRDSFPPLTQYERRLERIRNAAFIQENLSLHIGSIREWPDFVTRLYRIAQQDQPSPEKTIWYLISDNDRALIKKLSNLIESSRRTHPEKQGFDNLISNEDWSTVSEAINKVLSRTDFYRKEDYPAVEWPKDIEDQLNRDPNELSTREIKRLNRFLFDYVFLPEIDKVYHEGDIKDWERFCEKLVSDVQGKKRHPGKAIWEHLSPQIQNLISKIANGTEIEEEEEERIFDEFHEILECRDFYQADDFHDIPLPKKVQDTLGSPLFRVSDVLSWPRFVSRLSDAAREDAPSPGKTIYKLLPDELQSLIRRSTTRPPKQWNEMEYALSEKIKPQVRRPLEDINIEIEEEHELTDALNRYILGSPLFAVGDISDWSYFCSKFPWDVKTKKEEEESEEEDQEGSVEEVEAVEEEEHEEEEDKGEKNENEGSKEEEDSAHPGKVIWDLFPAGVQSLIKNWSVDTKVLGKENSTDTEVVEEDQSDTAEISEGDETEKNKLFEEDEPDDTETAEDDKPDDVEVNKKKKSQWKHARKRGRVEFQTRTQKGSR